MADELHNFTSSAPMHSHSLEEVNAGIFYPGRSCPDCPLPVDGPAGTVTHVDHERGIVTISYGGDD